jgi:hypothetical protein
MNTKYPYTTGICHTGRHTDCAGEYAGTRCLCPCHDRTEVPRRPAPPNESAQSRLF